MMMFIDGECEKCRRTYTSLDGGPPRCHECGVGMESRGLGKLRWSKCQNLLTN